MGVVDAVSLLFSMGYGHFVIHFLNLPKLLKIKDLHRNSKFCPQNTHSANGNALDS